MVVNIKKINQALNNWELYGDVTIDPKTGVVDVDGLVVAVPNLSSIGLQFGTVKGFDAQEARLRSLAGSPQVCKGIYGVQNNRLKTLQGASAHVGGLVADNNLLTNLDGLPSKINDLIDLTQNRLTTIKGLPVITHGDLLIGYNRLASLEGISSKIEGDFYCDHNPLVNLDHWPDHIGGLVKISWRPDLPLLKTLIAKKVVCVGAPEIVQKILTQYAGQGQQGALACAAELAAAGFKENARW